MHACTDSTIFFQTIRKGWRASLFRFTPIVVIKIRHIYGTINFDLRYSLILNTCRNLVSGLGSYRYSQNTCRIRRPKVNFLLVLGPYSSREQSLILDSYILLSNLYRYGKDYLVSGRGNSSLRQGGARSEERRNLEQASSAMAL